MAILGITMFGNTVDASSITGTKERIKEIKIVEEQSIDKLLRTKKFKITANYAKSKVEEVKEEKADEEKNNENEVTEETKEVIEKAEEIVEEIKEEVSKENSEN